MSAFIVNKAHTHDTLKRYFVVLEQRLELTAEIEAFNSREAYEKARRGEYDIDERTALNLPTKIKRVQWMP